MAHALFRADRGRLQVDVRIGEACFQREVSKLRYASRPRMCCLDWEELDPGQPRWGIELLGRRRIAGVESCNVRTAVLTKLLQAAADVLISREAADDGEHFLRSVHSHDLLHQSCDRVRIVADVEDTPHRVWATVLRGRRLGCRISCHPLDRYVRRRPHANDEFLKAARGPFQQGQRQLIHLDSLVLLHHEVHNALHDPSILRIHIVRVLRQARDLVVSGALLICNGANHRMRAFRTYNHLCAGLDDSRLMCCYFLHGVSQDAGMLEPNRRDHAHLRMLHDVRGVQSAPEAGLQHNVVYAFLHEMLQRHYRRELHG
eukprot:scaffold5944_cov248-Pinguiococcus_pyrenoidosus.AAC.9